MFWNQISEECRVFGMNSTKVSPWLHFTAGNGLFRTVFPKGLWPLLCLQRVIKAGASRATETMRLTFQVLSQASSDSFPKHADQHT